MKLTLQFDVDLFDKDMDDVALNTLSAEIEARIKSTLKMTNIGDVSNFEVLSWQDS